MDFTLWGKFKQGCDFPLSREQLPPAKNEAVDWNKTLGGSDIPAKIVQIPSLSPQLHGAPLLAHFHLPTELPSGPKGTTSIVFLKNA